MTYTREDAAKKGARCNVCILGTNKDSIRSGGFVAPETGRNANFAIVSDFPSSEEVKLQRPLVGKNGQIILSDLSAFGIKRDQLHITMACLCQPIGNRMENAEKARRIKNKDRAEHGMPLLLDPVVACQERLHGELSGYENIVTLGNKGYAGVTNSKVPIMNIRGAPVDWVQHATEGDIKHKLMPTLHPSFIMHQLRWRHVFKRDIARAFRWFRGDYGWKEPLVIYAPTFQQLRSFLQRKEKFFAIDTETDGIKPLTANLRCVGIGTADGMEVMIVPLLSIDGFTKFYSDYDHARIIALMVEFIQNPAIRKVGQNSGSYDQLVFIGQWAAKQVNILDTILLHRSVESEMPHNLAYIGSVYTDIGSAWKSEHTAVSAKTDHELHYYCALDVAITARVTKPLVDLVRQRSQENVVKIDHKIQEVCVGMHINGMLVDLKARDEWDKKLLKDALHHRKLCRDAVGDSNFNPASVQQVKGLLFDTWALPIINHVDKHDTSSEPSTDDDTIRSLMLQPGLTRQQLTALTSLRMFRRRAKLRGTYVVKLRKKGEIYTLDEFAIDECELDDAEQFTAKDVKKEGILDEDGRVRASWNAHGTNTGRLSCGRPMNLQNVPIKMRNLFVPADGRCFVYIDADQLELRLVTMFSGAKVYTQVFKEGGDPHSVSTLMVMGDEGRVLYDKAVALYGNAKKARKEDADWSRVCDYGKRFTYAAVYKAQVETIHDVLRSAEDENERLIYANLTIDKTQFSHKNWLNQNPEIEAWWGHVVNEYRDLGYLCDALHGRRCDFADGENENQIINYKNQSSGAALINEATLRLTEKVQFQKYGRSTGLVNQTHDALMLEMPLHLGQKAEKFLEECMHQRIPGYDMEFTGSAKSLKNWRGAKEDTIKWA